MDGSEGDSQQQLRENLQSSKELQTILDQKVGRFLHFSSKGDVEAVKRMIGEGMSVDANDYDGRTALHLAASDGKTKVVELLLDRGASPNPIDRWGYTPLADSERYSYPEICRILEAHGGFVAGDDQPGTRLDPTPIMEDIRRMASHGRSSLYEDDETAHLHKFLDETARLLYWASKGDTTEVNQLLAEGVDVDVADYDGRTALHLAASEGHAGLVQQLLEQGAFANPVDRRESTPLADARRYQHADVCRVLEAHGGAVAECMMTIHSPLGARSDVFYEIDPSELDFPNGRLIAKAACGEARVVNWRGTDVVAKTIHCGDPPALAAASREHEYRRNFKIQLSILQLLRHPNIVLFLGAITTENPHVIVTEYLPKGSLQEIMRRKGRLGSEKACKYALDIARGMNYLHEHKPGGIIHRDLTPENIFQDESGHLKVASRLFPNSPGSSDRYMAPEVYRHEHYSKAVDVFSFAIILQEMFEGLPCHSFPEPHCVVQDRAINCKRPRLSARSYPPGMKELIRECWHNDSSKRPAFSHILMRLECMKKTGQLCNIL